MRLYMIQLPKELVDPKTFETLLGHLPEDAQARIKRFRLPEDSLRALVGRLAPIWYLRQAGLIESDQSPSFQTTDKGKPYLSHPHLDPPLAFNTSHDGHHVFLGIARGKGAEIGVDVMRYPEDAWEIQEGISEQLTTDEKSMLALPMSEETRSLLITRIWTFKEGYVKATGDGIGFGLDRIALELQNDGTVDTIWVDGKDIKLAGWKWSYGSTSEGDRYGWMACWRGDEEQGDVELVSWESFAGSFQAKVDQE